jgi:hypothetical protein
MKEVIGLRFSIIFVGWKSGKRSEPEGDSPAAPQP